MLELLRIRNLALIEDAEMEFSPGMNVLTGETGAGKSFILRALDFLTGERMDRSMVRPGRDKATVEALFVLPDGDCVLRRELSAETGRSRIYINDRLGSQEGVRLLKPGLIIHTSQHGQQKLLLPAHQADILDGFLEDRELSGLRNQLYSELKNILGRKEELAEKGRALSQQRDFLEYQMREIEKVDPRPGEEEELEERKRNLKNREQAGESLRNVLGVIRGEPGLSEMMVTLSREVNALARLFPEYAEDFETVEGFRHFLPELESKLGSSARQENSADDLDRIEARLFEFSRLKRKLNRDLEGIADMRREIEENLSFLDSCELDRKQLEKDEVRVAQGLGKVLDKLNAARRGTAESLCRRIEEELSQLGFSEHVRVEYSFEEREIYPGLIDLRGRLMWIPNPGQAAQPLDKIASGGELSRFVLALVSLRGAMGGDSAGLPSLLFDEVDAGIGGLTLNQVGEKLKELAARQQVILITHWPQLAGLASRHFLISKDVVEGETFTKCSPLEGGEIMEELTRMGGGGDKGAALARELVNDD